MSSLPQGWHGIPVPTRNGISSMVASAAATVPTTIRKKWNSPMSNEVPRSKLPAYRPSTVRLHKSPVNGMLPTRNISKTSCPVPKNDATTGPPKPSPTKQYQNEIAKLKKELTTLKTENSILKVKVRRVDDENVQKSRQIEKLKVELKAAQKVESSNSKKSKDSELLVLRQKCLRLEGALKEKDLALKRLNNEASLKLEGTASRNSITNLAVGDGDDTKSNKLNEICRNSVKPGTAQTSLSRSSHSTKTEVAKLREMIHKLEKENQELQQQVKDKGEEIRRLKMHLRSRTYIKSPQTSDSKNVFKVNPTSKLDSVPNISKPSKPVPGTLKANKPVSTPPTKRPSITTKAPKIAVNQAKKPDIQSTPKPISRTNNLAQRNSIAVKKQKTDGKCNGDLKSHPVKKQANETHPKLPVTRPRKVTAPSKMIPNSERKNSSENKIDSALENKMVDSLESRQDESSENRKDDTLENEFFNIDDKVKEMRENIAAKKIQRSWRDHQKRHSGKHDQQSIQKALTFIVTSLKHHKLRKEKIGMLRRRKNLSPRIKAEDDSAIVAAVQAAVKSIWEKEMSITPVN
ncbi:uncharacterized protein LOC129957194 isoform X2 [Argiope bruennichi]|uniref:uncharacterized protein LOC129957194 isoform X2 n=1 Tax=Argiope bruennichi TaxID=94029 RepID=UPI0024942A19|nr:uncharacterized protein LOC129957194 isoform X2 [Argiope bruennichi]